jgi:beta-glucosidase
MISLFGYDGVAETQNTPEGVGINKWLLGLDGVQVLPGVGDFNDTYMWGLFASAEPYGSPAPGIALNGTLISGGGSGSTTPACIDAPIDAFRRQAQKDGTFLSWDFYNQNPTINAASEACIVFVNALASEGWDRPSLADSYSDKLIENVAANCSNTHVVLHNAGIRVVDRWINNPNITSVIYAHLPGQDSGQALVDVMYGRQSPSGRLPYTVAKKATDYGKTLKPAHPENSELWHPQANFTEGVYIDYKHFIAHNITPRFEFGYGLTYTTFSYSGLQIQQSGAAYPMQCPTNSSVVAEGGNPLLWETVATVSSTITNTGSVAAAEVAQLYIGIPGGPAKVLRGFEKVYLAPGASCAVNFELTRRDLSYWDVVSQTWVLQRGSYPVYVGKSVLDIQLQGALSM